MEAVCVVTCAALAWGMAFALLGQETRHVEGAGARLAESLWRRAVSQREGGSHISSTNAPVLLNLANKYLQNRGNLLLSVLLHNHME